jgi:hypothetical protein
LTQKFSFALVGLVALALTEPALAASGVVAYYESGCDYYVVSTNQGFSLLEWYGGYDPMEGDKLIGNMMTYGMQTLVDQKTENETTAWVEDFMLTQDSVLELYQERCP